jgi:hypothetical protein
MKHLGLRAETDLPDFAKFQKLLEVFEAKNELSIEA